jgi:hypothetical protein
VLPVRLSLREQDADNAEQAIWQGVVRRLGQLFGRTVDAGGPSATLAEHFRRLFRDAGPETRLLLLLDNADVLLRGPTAGALADNFRALISEERGVRENISVVFAGASDLHRFRKDTGSPLANVLSWCSLKLLDEDDVRALACAGGSAEGEPGFLAELFRLCGGHPCLAQFLLEEVGTDRTAARVRAAGERFLAERGVLFHNVWDRLERRDRLTYAELADNDLVGTNDVMKDLTGVEQVVLVTERLCHNGIARDQGGPVELAGELFRAWYRRHGRVEMLPPEEQAVRNLLLDGLEVRLRKLCAARLAGTAFGSCEGWKQAKNPKLPPFKAKLIYIGDYLGIMADQPELFEGELAGLGTTAQEKKGRLGELARTLGPVRNWLCHPKGEPADEGALRAARAAAHYLIGRLEAAEVA